MALDDKYFLLYEVPALLVHCSLTVFLVWQRHKKRNFASAFFSLFLAQGVARYVGYAVYVLNVFHRDGRYDVWRGVVQHLALVFIILSDSAIAFNRFTAIRLPWLHKNLWSNQRIVVFLSVAFFFALASAVLDRPFLRMFVTPKQGTEAHHITAAATFGTTFLVNISLEIYTLVYFSRLEAIQKRTRREELHLLVYAIVTEVTQLGVVLYYVCAEAGCTRMPGYDLMRWYMNYLRYFTWFFTAVLLLASSPSVRNQYWTFYRIRRNEVDKTGSAFATSTIIAT